MSPNQIAKAHCANFQSDGSCIGVHYNDDLTIKSINPLPKCLLAESGVRCPYFEECVMPQKLDDPEFQAGIQRYKLAVKLPAMTRICRVCQTNDTGSKKRQLCANCRRASRRESYRNSKRRSRQRDVHILAA
jgi:hypothetical protein